jgi:mannose-6-phosphate isomerase-like protein (cupin superfamily)
MRVLRLDDLTPGAIEHYGSRNATVTLLARGDAQVVRIELGAGSVLGMHPVAVPQLFVVVEGSGWAQTEAGEEEPLGPGAVVYWNTGESHETRSDRGLVALVVEAERLEPA